MDFFSQSSDKNQQEKYSNDSQEQAVFVNFEYTGGKDLSGLFELEEELEAAIEANCAGEYDGNEIEADDGNYGTLFMYGPDADKIFEVVRPILKSSRVIKNAEAIIRYGRSVDGGTEDKIVKI